MKRNIITALILGGITGSGALLAAPSGDWKLHPTFDKNVQQVIDTPHKTFFRALAQDVRANINPLSNPYPFLFAYDKEADELEVLTRRNMLSENLVYNMNYNADKGYLILIYDNANIDFIFDNGERHNVPALSSMTFTSGKGVNSISFDNANNRVWIAADFGVLVLDDKKFEVSQSIMFDTPVRGVCRTGEYVVLSTDNGIYAMPASERYPNQQSFTKVIGLDKALDIQPLEGGKALFQSDNALYRATVAEGELKDVTKIGTVGYKNLVPNKNGYFARTNFFVAQITPEGTLDSYIELKGDDVSVMTGSWDFKEFFFAENRKGLSSRTYSGDTWTVTRQPMVPNAPGVFRSTHIAYNPRYGMMVVDHGYSRAIETTASYVSYPSHLSSYKDGAWERYGLPYTKPEWEEAHLCPYGIAVDPDDPKYVYSGSRENGLVRYNLEDPDDLVRFTNEKDKRPTLGTVYNVFPQNNGYSMIYHPCFDAQGNLWVGTPHSSNTAYTGYKYAAVWPAEARRKGDMTKWIEFEINDWKTNWGQVFQALRHPSNSGIFMADQGVYGAPFYVYDCNKTLEDSDDDRVAYMGTLYDQDGGSVAHHYIYKFWEDMNTGMVWVLCDAGVFYFNPRNVFSNSTRVNRVKVSRNDGTNLADYLLDGVPVYDLATDPSGRKYFATGGGLVVTSSDGREILGQYTKENSYLPDDVIYAAEYNPDTNSIFLSTANGFCEFYPSGAVASDGTMDNIKVYPNPVRPDYYGWITVEGIPDGSLVKIVDSAGNLVKELGLSSGGTVQWDATNIDLKRVRSGVYYVMASSGPGEGSMGKVAKILVVN